MKIDHMSVCATPTESVYRPNGDSRPYFRTDKTQRTGWIQTGEYGISLPRYDRLYQGMVS